MAYFIEYINFIVIGAYNTLPMETALHFFLINKLLILLLLRVFRPCDLVIGDVIGRGFFGQVRKVLGLCVC